MPFIPSETVFSAYSLPDPESRILEDQDNIEKFTSTSDICVICFGSKWNYGCWQTWNTLTNFQKYYNEIQRQSRYDLGPDNPGDQQKILENERQNQEFNLPDFHHLLKQSSCSLKICLIDQEENIDLANRFNVSPGVPMTFISYKGKMSKIYANGHPHNDDGSYVGTGKL